jgi:hypothetical protein
VEVQNDYEMAGEAKRLGYNLRCDSYVTDHLSAVLPLIFHKTVGILGNNSKNKQAAAVHTLAMRCGEHAV